MTERSSPITKLFYQLAPLTDDFETSLDMLRKRTSHLSEIHEITSVAAAARAAAKDEPTEMDEPEEADCDDSNAARYQIWSDNRLHRMITDWLLRRGYVQSAQTFVKSRGIEAYTDLPVFRELFAIRASLIPPSGSAARPSCGMALTWCQENKVALRRFKSTLEFDLRMQEFIDLCKVRSPESQLQAIAYARKHLLPLQKNALEAVAKARATDPSGASSARADDSIVTNEDGDNEEAGELAANEKIVERVSRIMGLLAVGPGGWAYEEFYSSSRYARLYESLLSAALHIYSLPPQPLLHIALSAGLSSLKVPACYGGERAPTTSSTAAATTAAATIESTEGVTGGPGTDAGEVDEDLMRDVRREVKAETIKHEAESNKAGPLGVDPDDTRNNDCPVCATVSFPTSAPSSSSSLTRSHQDLGLGVLAKEVPWSHHSNSVIVCRLSGKVIDDSGESGGIVALPNGRVYSKRGIDEAIAASVAAGDDSNTVTCPRTKARFPRQNMRKVYIS